MSDDGRAIVVEALSGPADGVVFDSRREPGSRFTFGGSGDEVEVVARALREVATATFAVTGSDTLRVEGLGDLVVTVDGRHVGVGDEVAVGQILKVGVTELLVKRVGETVERGASSG